MSTSDKPLHIDIPVRLADVKVVFSIGSLMFEGDLPASMFHMGLIEDDSAAWGTEAEVVAVFHTNAGCAGVGEVVCAAGESARHDDRRLDAPARELPRVDDGHRVHPGLGREVRRQVGRGPAGDAAAGDPDQQSPALPPYLRKGGTVDALRAEDVHVVQVRQLLWREGLGGAEDHVTGIVHDDVDPAPLGYDATHRRIHRRLRHDVHLQREQVDAVGGGVLAGGESLRRVMSCRPAFRRKRRGPPRPGRAPQARQTRWMLP